MGLLFASPAPPLRAERQTGFALYQRFKSPKAASNLRFERPWDRLVPAKSVRKLTAPTVVSKKFLDRTAPPGDRPATSLYSADSAACFFGFSSRYQPHYDGNNDECHDGDAHIKRRNQTRAGRWSGTNRRRRRCVFRRQHSLHVLQTLNRVIVVWF